MLGEKKNKREKQGLKGMKRGRSVQNFIKALAQHFLREGENNL